MAVLDLLDKVSELLTQLRQEILEEGQPTRPLPSPSAASQKIAWGSKVSSVFKDRVLWIADALDCDPNDLMACMHWESGGTFSPSVKNAAGSGATGLIQFMPSTAKGLGTTTARLAAMTAEDQLRFVYEYFKPYAGSLRNLGDLYMAILWPKAIGKSDSFILFDRAKTPKTFRQNSGLDVNHDGLVTRAECLVKVNERLARGLLPENLG